MKKLIKQLIYFCFYILVLPMGLLTIITKKLFNTPLLFHFFAEGLSLVPAFIGEYVRACYYHQTLAKCPHRFITMFGTHFTKMESIIEEGAMVAGHTTIGLVKLCENSRVASNVSVISGRRQHAFDTVQDDILEGEDHFERIVIGKSAFIGEGCIIMADVGDYSIVGAGSVVVKDIPDYVVAVGNPAKVVKERPRPKSDKPGE